MRVALARHGKGLAEEHKRGTKAYWVWFIQMSTRQSTRSWLVGTSSETFNYFLSPKTYSVKQLNLQSRNVGGSKERRKDANAQI